MKLDSLKPPKGAKQDRKRIGRGSGSGTGKTAGRGHKGAASRSGYKQRPWFEGGQMPLIRRLPKRGFSNLRFAKDYQIVNLERIAELDLDTVDPQVLKQRGVIRSEFKPVKILGSGELTKAVTVTATAFSVTAIEKIEKAGGVATVL